MRKEIVSFDVESYGEQHEQLRILMDGQVTGEARITYQEATATIVAKVSLAGRPLVAYELDRFHDEFATELLAYVLNRGAMAQEQEGAIQYELDGERWAMRLPANHEVGLGYPNSW